MIVGFKGGEEILDEGRRERQDRSLGGGKANGRGGEEWRRPELWGMLRKPNGRLPCLRYLQLVSSAWCHATWLGSHLSIRGRGEIWTLCTRFLYTGWVLTDPGYECGAQ